MSGQPALVERLENAISNLEAVLVRQQNEIARLRAVESAAASALADLDALLAESEPLDISLTSIGTQG